MSDSSRTMVISRAQDLWQPASRRSFLKLMGIGGTVVLLPSVFAACDSGVPLPTGPGTGVGGGGNAVALNLSNDFGILNYAFALEQLEAGYYTAVLASAGFAGLNAEQKEILTDLQAHEVMHREFLRAALSTNAIPNLTLNAATVATTTANAAIILKTSETLEDTGVSAYNGAGKYLKSATYLTLAGKIVSVEARHAAAIRDVRDALGITGGTLAGTRFAGDDVVSASGLDVKLEPSAVLAAVAGTNEVSTSLSIGTPPPTTPGTPDAAPPPTP